MARGRVQGSKIVAGKVNKPAVKPEATIKESALDRFRRLGAKRVDNCLNDLRILANLGNPYQYQATPDQVEKIKAAILEAVGRANAALDRLTVAPEPRKRDSEERHPFQL